METDQSPKASLEFNGNIAVITLDNPAKHNAFDDSVIELLLAHLESVRARPQTRVLLLQASGKHFCAGADLGWMKRMAKLTRDENLADAKQLAQLMSTLEALPIPTVARVQGAAYGGAIGLIACCDVAIASEDARFCLSEVKLGLAPATIGPFVVAAMGSRRCRQLFVTAEVFGAQQAAQWSLIHKVVPADELDANIQSTLQQITMNGPEAVRAAKQLVRSLQSNEDHSDMTSRLIADLRVSEEGQEGLGAFFEKRQPAWQ